MREINSPRSSASIVCFVKINIPHKNKPFDAQKGRQLDPPLTRIERGCRVSRVFQHTNSSSHEGSMTKNTPPSKFLYQSLKISGWESNPLEPVSNAGGAPFAFPIHQFENDNHDTN